MIWRGGVCVCVCVCVCVVSLPALLSTSPVCPFSRSLPPHALFPRHSPPPKDSVTVPSESRLRITMACVLAAVLILCPMAPEIADSFGVGLNSASIM